jgi:hypothetical protein
MLTQYSWIAGSFVFLLLGITHLLYTFFSNKFDSREGSTSERMKQSSPVISKQTTMWKAWMGFNASHSAGAIYIGVINIVIAVGYETMIHNRAFAVFNLATVLFYLWLAKRYWFSVPFAGMLIATVCFAVAAFTQ